jgi:hypothetical protein
MRRVKQLLRPLGRHRHRRAGRGLRQRAASDESGGAARAERAHVSLEALHLRAEHEGDERGGAAGSGKRQPPVAVGTLGIQSEGRQAAQLMRRHQLTMRVHVDAAHAHPRRVREAGANLRGMAV